MRRLTILLSVLLLISCGQEKVLQNEFTRLDQTQVRLDSVIEKQNATVLIFLSPECPLCQNYCVTIDQLQADFKEENISFYGVVSGQFYSISDIEGFLIRYDLDIPVLIDQEFQLADYYGASITPEAIVIDAAGESKYQGAIDNWAISLGKKRLTITEHYLADALKARLEGKEIEPKKTEAVGCYIE